MKKQKTQKIQSKLHTRSFAQLDKEVAEILKQDLEDKDISEFINDGKEFAGWSPPHEMDGATYDEMMEKKKQLEDENS
jgi:ribosomal protein L12E/L44/L45/RPP1/RPP2